MYGAYVCVCTQSCQKKKWVDAKPAPQLWESTIQKPTGQGRGPKWRKSFLIETHCLSSRVGSCDDLGINQAEWARRTERALFANKGPSCLGLWPCQEDTPPPGLEGEAQQRARLYISMMYVVDDGWGA